jgi:hypothetical protein
MISVAKHAAYSSVTFTARASLASAAQHLVILD